MRGAVEVDYEQVDLDVLGYGGVAICADVFATAHRDVLGSNEHPALI